MMIMELTELKYLNNIDMLKYLVYFQVCQDNSLHLYTYKIYKVISPISGKTGGLLAVARGDRFLYACFMTLSS